MYTKKLLFFFFHTFLVIQIVHSQCNNVQTISVCDMENIDFDNDGNPDGIINLYTETGTTPADGTWTVNPQFSVTLDTTTGDVRTWEFFDATQSNTLEEYRFELFNATCGTDPFLTTDLILGPFSGVALPPGINNDANIEICSSSTVDLFEALTSDVITPSPHLNGTWQYVGNSSGAAFTGSFTLAGSSFSAVIPYEPGPPTVDNEVFELKYVVEGVLPCNLMQETTVKVSVVRQVDPGIPVATPICETEILAGNWDTDIDLSDDAYLSGEDIEGVWSSINDPTGQIENAQDSFINIRAIYDDLIDNGNNLRFGCQTYGFTYTVPQRSAVCVDQAAIINFTLYEELRPFNQTNDIPVLCANRMPSTFDLFDLLEFTNINGNDFIYNDDTYVNWRLVSGPSSLGLLPQPDVISDFDPSIDYHLGTVTINGAQPGTYVFEYGVTPDINCPTAGALYDPFVTNPTDATFSNNPCEVLTTLVTIEIVPFDYAGEDTSGLTFCETVGSIDLRSQLQTNGNTIATTGVWTDSDGDVINNTFDFPPITNTQLFTFTYTTTTSDGCEAAAELSFSIFKEANAGSGTSTTLCSDSLTITLFDLLEGDPDTTGIWTGPFGYSSPDHLGVFDTNDAMLPILGPGDYVYTVAGNTGCTSQDQATVSIAIVEPVEIGNDRFDTFCKIDGSVNLFSILDNDTPRNGQFEDTDATGALSADGMVAFETLTNGTFDFRYTIPNAAPCDESSLIVSIQIVDLPEPDVPDQEFCILDATRLDAIEVDVLNFNWYPTLESDMPIIDNPILFDNQIYYIATVDANNCESERVAVTMNILNIGERFTDGSICTLDFQDGVSPDGNNQNDTFDLLIEGVYNIPEAFPDFTIDIFNRYGNKVYQGNVNTQEFNGESNTSIRLGDDLPSGTYFYIFTPNFENNLPIQGSFYLSR